MSNRPSTFSRWAGRGWWIAASLVAVRFWDSITAPLGVGADSAINALIRIRLLSSGIRLLVLYALSWALCTITVRMWAGVMMKVLPFGVKGESEEPVEEMAAGGEEVVEKLGNLQDLAIETAERVEQLDVRESDSSSERQRPSS